MDKGLTSGDTVFLSHVFVNLPGVSHCGNCGQDSNHPAHIKDSSNKTYRKPIKGRFDLIPPVALRALAEIYEEGANVYGESKYISSPMPHSVVVNHMINHLTLAQSGDRSEDHWAKIAWAAFTMIVYERFGIGKADLTAYGIVSKNKEE